MSTSSPPNLIVRNSPLWAFQAQFDRETAYFVIWEGLKPLLQAHGKSGDYCPDWRIAKRIFDETRPFRVQVSSIEEIVTARFIATYLRSEELAKMFPELPK